MSKENYVEPNPYVTVEMLELAKTDDLWHFAENLNAMMEHGYCKKCNMTPNGCKREGCQNEI